LVYTQNAMQTSHSHGQRSWRRSHPSDTVQPYATHRSASKKWLRYAVRAKDIYSNDRGSLIICDTGSTLPQNYIAVFLREGSLLAPLPLKYFQNRQPMRLDFSCSSKCLKIQSSAPLYLAPSLPLNIEIIRYPAKKRPSLVDIQSISEWINGVE